MGDLTQLELTTYRLSVSPRPLNLRASLVDSRALRKVHQKPPDAVGEIGGSFGCSYLCGESGWAASLGIGRRRHDVSKLLDHSAHASASFGAFLISSTVLYRFIYITGSYSENVLMF